MKKTTDPNGDVAVAPRPTHTESTAAVQPRVASPFTAMRRLMEDMDRAFDEWSANGIWPSPVFGGDPLVRRFGELSAGAFLPEVEVIEKPDAVVVRADLPGVRRDEIKVEVNDGAIVISGERRKNEEQKGEGYYRSERSYGSFYRSVPLPRGAKSDEATAKLVDGVLEVTVATEASNGRAIEVK